MERYIVEISFLNFEVRPLIEKEKESLRIENITNGDYKFDLKFSIIIKISALGIFHM